MSQNLELETFYSINTTKIAFGADRNNIAFIIYFESAVTKTLCFYFTLQFSLFKIPDQNQYEK